MAKKSRDKYMFYDERVRGSMSRTAITLKFKISRLLGKHKKPTTTTKAKASRVERLQADIKTLTHFTPQGCNFA